LSSRAREDAIPGKAWAVIGVGSSHAQRDIDTLQARWVQLRPIINTDQLQPLMVFLQSAAVALLETKTDRLEDRFKPFPQLLEQCFDRFGENQDDDGCNDSNDDFVAIVLPKFVHFHLPIFGRHAGPPSSYLSSSASRPSNSSLFIFSAGSLGGNLLANHIEILFPLDLYTTPQGKQRVRDRFDYHLAVVNDEGNLIAFLHMEAAANLAWQNDLSTPANSCG